MIVLVEENGMKKNSSKSTDSVSDVDKELMGARCERSAVIVHAEELEAGTNHMWNGKRKTWTHLEWNLRPTGH